MSHFLKWLKRQCVDQKAEQASCNAFLHFYSILRTVVSPGTATMLLSNKPFGFMIGEGNNIMCIRQSSWHECSWHTQSDCLALCGGFI